MRKYLKDNILELFQTIYEAHKQIMKFIDNKDFENAQIVLSDCQNAAANIVTAIENSEGEGFITVGFLEEYYKTVYEVATSISDDYNGKKVQKTLDKKLIKAENSIKNDINVKLEVVFMPYKASMWDSMESVWEAANKDINCNAFVIPIPYFDRNADFTLGKRHYEASDFPPDVPITNYKNYNLELRHPDIIFIHNCYDDNNFVTTVHPNYYTDKLKKYTDKLAYLEYGIPLWVFNKPEKYDNYISGWFNIDLYFTYSKQYAKNQEYAMKLVRPQTTTEFIPLGSPKFDKVINSKKDDFNIPASWKNIINNRKIILLNTSLGEMLNNTGEYLKKLSKILETIKNNKNVILWWRPHPLSIATINSMRNIYQTEYMKILNTYKEEDWGICDESSDVHRAIAYADAYYGDESSLVYMFCATGKPFTLSGRQHQLKYFTENTDSFEKSLQWRMHNMENYKGANLCDYNVCMWWHNFSESVDYIKYLELFLDFVVFPEKYPDAEKYKNLQLKIFRDFVENSDGTAGTKIYSYCKNKILRGF